jgi:hypothetical protein
MLTGTFFDNKGNERKDQFTIKKEIKRKKGIKDAWYIELVTSCKNKFYIGFCGIRTLHVVMF